MTWWIFADLVLALGFGLRLTRLVTTDKITEWLILNRLWRWADYTTPLEEFEPTTPRTRLVYSLSCPWCVGFWVSAIVVISMHLAWSFPDWTWLWRMIATIFTINWVAATIHTKLEADDASEASDHSGG